MKTFVQTAGLFIVALMAMFIIGNSFSRAAMDTEMENTLETAVEHALYVAMTEDAYTIDDKDKLAAAVLHELFASCNTKAEYTIAFNVIDIENGLVDVQVTQTVQSFPLIKSKAVCRKTVILETVTGA